MSSILPCALGSSDADGAILGLAVLVGGLAALLFGVRFLARSWTLSLLFLALSAALVLGGLLNRAEHVAFWGLVLVALTGVSLVLATIRILVSGVGRAVTQATGSETLGNLAAIGTSVAVGGAVLGEIVDADGGESDFGDAGEGRDVGGLDFEPQQSEVVGAATCTAHMCTDGEIHVGGPHPGPDGFGEPSEVDGDPRTNPVHGYYRKGPDGSKQYVDPHWKGKRG